MAFRYRHRAHATALVWTSMRDQLLRRGASSIRRMGPWEGCKSWRRAGLRAHLLDELNHLLPATIRR